MRPSLYPAFLFVAFLALSLSATSPAFATLGEGPSSVVKNRKLLKVIKHTTTTNANYTVDETVSRATTVRQFLDNFGVVFAVAWDGLVHPDLTTLLGAYNEEIETAQQVTPRSRGQNRALIQSQRVVVETWGHMRHVQGRAYIPSLVPTGVNIDEIK